MIENKTFKRNPLTGHMELEAQNINIDGEDLKFHKYVKVENLMHSLEFIVDFKMMFQRYYPMSML